MAPVKTPQTSGMAEKPPAEAKAPARRDDDRRRPTVAALIAHGFDNVYALPGVHNHYLFDALYHVSERLKTVHSRH